jgi:hypothetical protein
MVRAALPFNAMCVAAVATVSLNSDQQETLY